MSTPQRLSDDPTLQPLLKSTFSAAVKAGELYNIKASDLKARLLDAGWTGPGASEKGWKAGWKSTVSEEWKRMVDEYHVTQQQEEEKPKPKSANKYERAAERNLDIFNELVAGDLNSGLSGDDEEEEDASSFITSDSGVGASDETGSAARNSSMDVVDSDTLEQKEEEVAVPVKSKPKPKSSNKKEGKSTKSKSSSGAADKPKKKRTPTKKAEFKSKATISDSDESSHSASASGSGRAAPSSSVPSEGEGEEEGKKSSKGKGKGKKKTGEKKERKKSEPKLKEGDEPKGIEEEEDRIVKLKALLNHAGVLRPFTKETGAERTLTVSTRLARLEGLLNDLGLKCGSGVGTKMPSEARCKEVGEAKALEKEMKDLKGAPSTSGLRGGKKRASLGGDDDEERPKKKFGAFLSALQSDSD